MLISHICPPNRCISKDPDDETPRRISTDGQFFRSLVWDLNEAKLFMVVSGWMEVGTLYLLTIVPYSSDE
jgi:hypothetical protein